MALNTGITIIQGTSEGVELTNDLAIAVFGTTSTGTITPGELTKIQTKQEATDLVGDGGAGDTLPKAIDILQRYNCGNIIVCAITGVDAAAEEADLIDKLDLLNSAISLVGVQPRLILFPSFNSDNCITKAISIASDTLAIAIANFTAGTSVADALTERGGATALGQDDQRLAITHGYLVNSNDVLEGLDVHLAGVMANRTYGSSPLGYPLKEVNGVDVSINFSLSDENSDPEQLNDVGVVSVNVSPENNLVLWGSRNSSYTEDESNILTFINGIRARDEISRLAKERALKMLGLPSRFSTAALLTASYRTMLGDEVGAGNIASYTIARINLAKTDYENKIIWHDLEFQIWLPLERIGANVYLGVAA